MKRFFTKVQRKHIIYPLTVLILFGISVFTVNIFLERYHLRTDAITSYLSKSEATEHYLSKAEIIKDYPTKVFIEKHYLSIANANILGGQINGVKNELTGIKESITLLNGNFETLLKIALDTNRKVVLNQRDTSPDDFAIANFNRYE